MRFICSGGNVLFRRSALGVLITSGLLLNDAPHAPQ
jgi:hypothetical protein